MPFFAAIGNISPSRNGFKIQNTKIRKKKLSVQEKYHRINKQDYLTFDGNAFFVFKSLLWPTWRRGKFFNFMLGYIIVFMGTLSTNVCERAQRNQAQPRNFKFRFFAVSLEEKIQK